MANSTYYVNTSSLVSGDGTGGIDVIVGADAAFSSMQDAINSVSTSAISGDAVTIKGKGVDGSFDIDGFTDGVSVIIEADESARHNGVWDDSKYYFTGTGHMVGVLDGSVELRYLQITDTTTSVRNGVTFGSGGKSATAYRCIIKDVTTAFFNSSSNSSPTIEECLVYRSSSAIDDGSSQGAGFNVKRCTFVDCNDLDIGNKSNLPIFNGNAFSDITGGIIGTVDAISNYNATNLGNLGATYTNNTGDLVNQAIDFVDAINDDYRIVSTSPLKTAGELSAPIGAFYEVSGGVTKDAEPINSIISMESEKEDATKSATSQLSESLLSVKSEQALTNKTGLAGTAKSTVNLYSEIAIASKTSGVLASSSRIDISSTKPVTVKVAQAYAGESSISIRSEIVNTGTDISIIADESYLSISSSINATVKTSKALPIQSSIKVMSEQPSASKLSAAEAIGSVVNINSTEPVTNKAGIAIVTRSAIKLLSFNESAIKLSNAAVVSSVIDLSSGIGRISTSTMPTFSSGDISVTSSTNTYKAKSTTDAINTISNTNVYNLKTFH